MKSEDVSYRAARPHLQFWKKSYAKKDFSRSRISLLLQGVAAEFWFG